MNDLLDLARVEAGKLVLEVRRIDLTQFVDDALTTYSSVFAKRQQKINKFLSPNVFAYVDPDRFSQILNNLLDNAAKYTPVNGTISISLSIKGADAELKIADNGIGISEDVLPNIFKFYLQDNAARAFNHDGLGIGLAVVQELTRAHGGEIVAHSEGHGKGSEFIVTIPHAKLGVNDTEHATPSLTNKNTLISPALQNQATEDEAQIDDLKEKLRQAKNEFLFKSANLRSANEELIISALSAQVATDEASVSLKKMTDSITTEVQARTDQNRIEFLARVSHELRTPLNAILGFGQLMLGDDENQQYLDHSQRERLECIRRAGQQLLELTQGLLGKRSTHDEASDIVLKPVELLDVIGTTLTLLEKQRQERQVQWQWTLTEPCSIWGDVTTLQRALHDVIAHALQNSVVAGTVEGSLRGGFNSVNIMIGYQDCSAWPSVDDVSPQSELFAAKALLELMQGTLTIHHPMPGVTALQVTLKPTGLQSFSEKSSQPSTQSCSQEETGVRHRVLYIEDNPVNAMVMKQIFTKNPQWEFSIATTGVEGLELAASIYPSLILLDMQLGDMSGLQVFSMLKSKKILPPCGCIALSADALSEHINEALDAGFTDYWTKPLDIECLIEKLHVLLPETI